MTEPTSAQDLFKGRHFDQEIIVLCVRWYLAFKLSSRDLVQMMAERGITLSHTTILRWVQQYVPERCCVERLIFSKADRAVRSRRSANVFTILDSIVHN
jgi:transposase-like protein